MLAAVALDFNRYHSSLALNGSDGPARPLESGKGAGWRKINSQPRRLCPAAIWNGGKKRFNSRHAEGAQRGTRLGGRFVQDGAPAACGAGGDVFGAVIQVNQIRAAPEFAGELESDYITGLGTVAERMLILVDIEKLMTSRDMALVDQQVH